ncbi:DUF4097 and DUF4098 domain-containing protein YvlB [Paenibacillus taihuensis]|uniref:DUF4097 and DUF4098 domain-containing protein YvlB n=1 Tax=Paenibacillus taihuensis TaxID=1156355 RepID=A0A3D9RI57_9BACL|nr:DUF4097 family beta strand repeat-containing protein [Paenibacillus taihuensis]REE78782.1 DUF4097 and DUF4098 domain-containing protein YvlB [Paenibacillus taihuensis]
MRNWIVVALVLLVAGLIGTFSSFHGDFTFGTEKINQQKTMAVDGISDIMVKSGSMDVTIVPSSDQQVKATLSGRVSRKYLDKLSVSLEREGNQLNVSLEDKVGFTFGLNFRSVNLTLELPQQMYRKLVLDTGSGDTDVRQVQADRIELDTGSGDVDLEQLTGSTLSVVIGSGNLDATDITANESAELKAQSGDVTVDGLKSKQLTAKTGSGNIELNDVDAVIKGEARSGDIDLALDALNQTVDLETGSGDVSIMTREQPQNAHITYSTGSGDLDNDWDGAQKSTDADDRDNLVFGSGAVPVHIHTGSGDLDVGAR